MEMNDIIQTGAKLFQGKIDREGDGIDLGDITHALKGLMADDKGEVNMSSFVSNLNVGDLMSTVTSWLGNDENKSVSSSQVSEMFSADKITEFATKLGISEEKAVDALKGVVPDMVDKSSTDGSLLDSVGGLSGVFSMASKFFR